VPEVTTPIHDFRHTGEPAAGPYNGPMSGSGQRPAALHGHVRGARWLSVAAVVTWLVCGLPLLAAIVAGTAPFWPALVFMAAFLIYGAALMTVLSLLGGETHVVPRSAVVLLAVESLSGLTLIYVSGHHLGGTAATPATLVIVSAQAPYILSARAAWALVGAQTLAMVSMFWGARLTEILSMSLAMGGFQAFATASSFLALREAAARSKLALANAELHAAQARLSATSRAEERLRISRDLHDALGHHLTALSLQLDVASRLSDGRAAAHVSQAHAIARLLLSDVRDVVRTLRDPQRVDVAQAIRNLAGSRSEFAIHLEVPSALELHDAERAQALLRCVQEIITNTARHARAQNLWIRIEPRADGIALHARDDGRGTAEVTPGYGLTGMQERFAACAGFIEFGGGPDRGFEVRGFMPVPHAAAS
jgi:signal transduction histidine kinase